MNTQKIVFEQGNKQIIKENNKFFTRITEGEECFESGDFNTIEKAKANLDIALTIEENNIIVADFMDITYIQELKEFQDTKNQKFFKDVFYHSDWNWLMEVVKKIIKDFYKLNPCPIGLKMNIEKALNEVDIEAVYNTCIEFIKWNNNQKQ